MVQPNSFQSILNFVKLINMNYLKGQLIIFFVVLYCIKGKFFNFCNNLLIISPKATPFSSTSCLFGIFNKCSFSVICFYTSSKDGIGYPFLNTKSGHTPCKAISPLLPRYFQQPLIYNLMY